MCVRRPCPHGYSPVDLPLLENYHQSILDSPSCAVFLWPGLGCSSSPCSVLPGVANLDSECEQTISFAGVWVTEGSEITG